MLQPPNVASDNPSMNQGGFRADWTPTRQDTFTIQSDFYKGVDKQNGTFVPPAVPSQMDCSTSTILTRWARKIDDETDWAMQLYYYNPYAIGYNLNNVATFDMDFQYHFNRDRHDVVCGVGYRNNNEAWIYGPNIFVARDNEQIPSYFFQDTITLDEDRFFLTLGAKFDHNSVTTFEFQPTARILWTPDKQTSIWAAISHAVRTPALDERIFTTPNAEELMAYEMGVRRQANDKLFWDLAVFNNCYSGLLGANTYYYEKVGNAETYGFEYSSTYTVNPQWRLTGSYSFLVENYQWWPGYYPENPDGSSPRNQFYLQSGWDLSDNITLDVMFRYVDSLVVGVPSYFANDVRCAWRPAKNLELSVVGQNLFAGKHYEYIYSSIANPTEIGPAVYGMVTWRY